MISLEVANTPEPAPQGGHGDVWLDAIRLLQEHMASKNLIDLCLARREFGIAKYGTPLTYNDGRDPINDAVQEILDLIVYLTKAKRVDLLPLCVTIFDEITEKGSSTERSRAELLTRYMTAFSKIQEGNDND